MVTIKLHPNRVNILIEIGDNEKLASDLFEKLTFKEENWQFKKRRYPTYTGDVRFIKPHKKDDYSILITSVGFYYDVIELFDVKNIDYETDIPNLITQNRSDFRHFYEKLIDRMGFQFRDIQFPAAMAGVENDFGVLYLDTNSGKTFIIFSMVVYLIYKKEINKVLIVCTDLNLTNQMYNDFLDYSSDFLNIKILMCNGKNPAADFGDNRIIISNYQYLGNKPKSYFKDVSHLYFDECDLCTTKYHDKIIKHTSPNKKRIGLTGSLPNPKYKKYNVIKKKTGKIIHRISKEELMNNKYSAKPIIEVKELYYLDDRNLMELYDCKLNCDEDDLFRVKMLEHEKIRDSEVRLDWLSKLILFQEGNGVVFCADKKHKYGLKIKERILSLSSGKEIYYADGDTSIKDRQTIIDRLKSGDDRIVIVTYDIWGRGISIPNLEWLIAAEPKKNRTTINQAMGRGERTKGDKTHYKWIDIVDNFDYRYELDGYEYKYKSYTMKSFSARKSFYNSRNWPISNKETINL